MERSGMLRPTCCETVPRHRTLFETKTTNLHRAPPLIMHFVSGCRVHHSYNLQSFLFVRLCRSKPKRCPLAKCRLLEMVCPPLRSPHSCKILSFLFFRLYSRRSQFSVYVRLCYTHMLSLDSH